MKEHEFMTENSIDTLKLSAYFDESGVDPIWLQIIKKTSSYCLETTVSNIDDIKEAFLDALDNKLEKCDVGIMAYIECHMIEMYAACPANSWKNTKECNTLKDSVVKCNENIENVVLLYLSKIPKA